MSISSRFAKREVTVYLKSFSLQTHSLKKLKYSMAHIQKTITIAVDFGTSRSGFAYINDGENIQLDIKSFKNWEGALIPYDKNLTQILYDPSGNPISFGYNAPRVYSELIFQTNDISQYTLFKFFKMQLQKKTNPDGIIKNEVTGKEFNLVEVIADYLIYIRKIIEKTTGLDLSIHKDNVRWCFTVPAIWEDEEKQQTKEACRLAGFIDDIDADEDEFLFAPEPEAAAAYCLQELLQSNQLSSGEIFLVCDAGGGTVDLTSHMLVKEGDVFKLKAMTKGGGGACGSSYLDAKFIQVMTDIFGQEFMHLLKTSQPALYEELLGLWEKKKVKIENITSQTFIALDGPLKDFFTQNANSTNSQVKNHFRLGRIILSLTFLEQIFNGVLNEIEGHIQKELDQLRENFQDSTKDFNYIFVVGGFGESVVLQNRLIQTFQSPTCKVLIPPSPGGAIVKGAVMLGRDPSLIVTRRMRRSYGVTSYKKFIQNTHDEKKKIRLKGRSDPYCKDCFDIYVDVNEEVRYDQVVVREYGVTSESQESMILELYMSPKPNTRYVTESFVKKCGEIIIDMKGTNGLNRMVDVQMYFGKSAIEIHATDKTTNKIFKASVDFERHLINNAPPPGSSQVSSEQFHFIFVNDKSGSMGGNDARPSSSKYSTNRLGALFESCEKFLEVRDGSNDVVSCIMYDYSAHSCFTTLPLSTALVNNMSSYYADGGTSFSGAMSSVSSLISSTHSSYQGYTIVVLFMSDGEDSAGEAIQITRNLVSSYGIILHTIQLGGSTDNIGLQQMAAAGNGQFKRANDSASLAGIYKEIANHPVAN